MSKVILQGAGLDTELAQTVANSIGGELSIKEHYSMVVTQDEIFGPQLERLRDSYKFDINVMPAHFEEKKAALLVMDMDSTLINIECVDEIADYLNVKPQVSAITEAAMRGEIGFETSLRQRVSLLKGLDVDVLERVFRDRLQLNPGAELMLKELQKKGIKTALVSGGFTFFTERLKQQLGLDYTMANVLAENDGKLTGEVMGNVCGAKAKADFLLSHCEKLAISPSQTIAMGDGANDLLMMKEAGLSIAYHAKPKVQQQANTRLNYCGLEGVLGMLQLAIN